MSTLLHIERLDAVVRALLDSGATSVLDLGCGPGELLLRLREHPQFVRLLGIDIDERALADARAVLGLNWLLDGRGNRAFNLGSGRGFSVREVIEAQLKALEKRQGLKVACPEEIAFRAGWISAAELEAQAQPMLKNGYGQYLMKVLDEKVFR